MAHTELGPFLRGLLLVTLSAPLVACSGGLVAGNPPTPGDDASTPSPTPETSPVDAAVVDAMVILAQDAGDASTGDASLVDAADAGPYGCTVLPVAPGDACLLKAFSCASGALPAQLDCVALCNVGQSVFCRWLPDVAGGTTLSCMNGACAGGRRPDGYEAATRDALGSVGGFFACLAELEAASVDAFEILRDELVAHGAPDELVRLAEDAARDEVRHAKITRALAARYGRSPREQTITRRAIRDLTEIAIENAAEGCVRETFGALLAMHQAEHASDPVIRRAMRRIAEDETRHADLSWKLAAWITPQLDVEARARVAAAMREATSTLAQEVAVEPANDVQLRAGVPSGALGARFVESLRSTLWAS